VQQPPPAHLGSPCHAPPALCHTPMTSCREASQKKPLVRSTPGHLSDRASLSRRAAWKGRRA
jgi:hypothetical protein